MAGRLPVPAKIFIRPVPPKHLLYRVNAPVHFSTGHMLECQIKATSVHMQADTATVTKYLQHTAQVHGQAPVCLLIQRASCPEMPEQLALVQPDRQACSNLCIMGQNGLGP